MKPEKLLNISNLCLEFPQWDGALHALDDISITVNRGEIVGLVGESGCGKSITAMSVMRLLPKGAYRITAGSIEFLGNDMLNASDQAIRELRGNDISMIFQEPLTALNPTRRVGDLIREVICAKHKLQNKAARERVLKLLQQMRIADAESIMDRYPFELSGGMRQRIVIALAFANHPQLVIADEPTTALDVTVQRQVLSLLQIAARETSASVLLITHDLGVISEYCDRVYVMYAGKVVEEGKANDVLLQPLHPYTKALLRAIPDNARPKARLNPIAGTYPNLKQQITGCRYASRCKVKLSHCNSQKPPLQQARAKQHKASCWLDPDR